MLVFVLVTIPDSAKIYDDSTLIGYSPLTVTDTVAKVHYFVAKYEGYHDTAWSRVASLGTLRQDTVILTSKELLDPISFSVVTNDEQADIKIDGKLLGRKEVEVKNLIQGKHVLAIEGFNIEPYYDTLDLLPGDDFRMVIPVNKRKFSLVGVHYSRDFASYDLAGEQVVLGEQQYELNYEEAKKAQRDLIITAGSSQDNNNSGFIFTAHFPHEYKFETVAQDNSDTLHMTAKVWGVGVQRSYQRTVAAIEDILRFDIGFFWGPSVKVRQYRYHSNNGSGGISDFQLKNTNNVALAPLKGHLSVAGIDLRLLAGYKFGFLTLNYHFNPSVELDGIGGYPDNPVNYRGVHRLMIGATGRF